MKILFIGTKKCDYLQDLTYSGLHKILGNKSLVELNAVMRYHLPVKRYPKNLGYVSFNPLLLGRRYWKDVDVVMVGAAKPSCFTDYEAILPHLNATTKTVFIDGGDWDTIGGDFKRLNCEGVFEKVINKRPFDVVFKREYLKDVDYSSNVHPLPFSINEQRYKGVKQLPFRYDVAFWAVESHPIRKQVFDFMRPLYDCATNGTIPNQVAKQYKRKGRFYFEEVKRTRISLNFRGTGWDTLRFWEIMGLGSFMISQRPGIVVPDDFVEGKEIIYCKDDLTDLQSLCDYYLKHEDARHAISVKAARKAAEFHTDVARANYVLSKL